MKLFKSNKVHVYLVCWETQDVQNHAYSSGYTEVTLNEKLGPGMINDVMDFIHGLIGEDYQTPTPKSVTYLGETERKDAQG